jgi:pimeloyl-ACP methyl ester carboxylesterase/DNA-binding CsgD family transcriptional regulator
MGQPVRFCASADGIRIAYTSDGSGPPLVRTAFYLNHLELDWQCPVWKPYLDEFSRYHTLWRHDMRGFGLSDSEVSEQSMDAWVHDLEAVVDAAGLEKFPLVGMCHGGAIAVEYAARHPERVTQLVLFGAYARGRAIRATTPEQIEASEMLVRLAELGWGADNDAFRQIWPTLFQPSSTLERLRALAELQHKSSNGTNAGQLLRATARLDVREAAPKVRCPTLVLHAMHNQVAPLEEGRLLAALIPDARLVTLESDNHVLTEVEPAWRDFVEEFHRFLPSAGAVRERMTSWHGLTPRELEVLERVAQGLDNAQIAAHLDMAEKTVRNHVSHIFEKLGAENRPQAIVRARDAGLGIKPANH